MRAGWLLPPPALENAGMFPYSLSLPPPETCRIAFVTSAEERLVPVGRF